MKENLGHRWNIFAFYSCLCASLCNIVNVKKYIKFIVHRQNPMSRGNGQLDKSEGEMLKCIGFFVLRIKKFTNFACTNHSITHVIADNAIAVLSSRTADFCLLYQ